MPINAYINIQFSFTTLLTNYYDLYLHTFLTFKCIQQIKLIQIGMSKTSWIRKTNSDETPVTKVHSLMATSRTRRNSYIAPTITSKKYSFSSRQIDHFLTNLPEIIQNQQKYRDYYTQKLQEIMSVQKMCHQLPFDSKTENINVILSKHLRKEEESKNFHQKNNIPKILRKEKVKQNSEIYKTKYWQEKNHLEEIMNNPEQRSSLYETSLLLEYYLKDLEKERTDIRYLNKEFSAGKHKRLTNNSKDNQKLHLQHEQFELNNAKLLNYTKHEKQIHEAVNRAKKNNSYRKSKNIERINYIIDCFVEKPLLNNNLQSPDPQQQSTRKLFFRYSNVVGLQNQLYQYLTLVKFTELMKNLDSKIDEALINQVFRKLTKYKSNKAIYYADFLESLKDFAFNKYKQNRQTPHDSNKVQEYKKRYIKEYIFPRHQEYVLPIEKSIKLHQNQINQFMEQKRLKYYFHEIFKSESKKHEFGDLASYSIILSTLTRFGILKFVGKSEVKKYFFYLCLNQIGLNETEFMMLMNMLALSYEVKKLKPQECTKLLQEGVTICQILEQFFLKKVNIYPMLIEYWS